jgi:hypothetical protein
MDSKIELSRKSIVIVTIVLILCALVGTCAWQAREERRRAEEIATAQGLARVIVSTFSGKTELLVSDIKGTIDVTSVNHGWIFDSKLKGTLPFSVDYFVDLSALSLEKFRYDKTSRTLFVHVPDVRIAEPNINLAKGSLGDIEGWWVSREASKALVNRAVKLANQKANEEAVKKENIEKARAEARQRISGLLDLPLQAAGFKDVKVVARFPTEGSDEASYMDLSRSYNEVLEDAASNRR